MRPAPPLSSLCLSSRYTARDKSKLTQLGITHVVNVAAGKFQVDTGAKFYRGMPLEYYGIEADDNPFFDLSVYFLPIARYIRTALSVPQGELLGKALGRGRGIWDTFSSSTGGSGVQSYDPLQQPSHPIEQIATTI